MGLLLAAPSVRYHNSYIGAISCQPHSGDIIIITPLGSARGAIVAATPRLRSGYNRGNYPSASLGIQSWQLPLGFARDTIVATTPRLRSGCNRGSYPSASLGVQSWQLPLGFARGAIVAAPPRLRSGYSQDSLSKNNVCYEGETNMVIDF